MLNTLTLGERNTYSSANALTLPVAVLAVNALAMANGNVAMVLVLVLVLVVAAVAGLCLAAWSRLLYSLIAAENRWIVRLVGLATVGILLAAWAESWHVMLGVAVLLFVGWLPFMVAESAGQALRERAYWAQALRPRSYWTRAAYGWRLSQWAQALIDIATIGATAVFLAVAADGQLPPVRLAATLILIAPQLLSRAADRSGPPPAPYWPTPAAAGRRGRSRLLATTSRSRADLTEGGLSDSRAVRSGQISEPDSSPHAPCGRLSLEVLLLSHVPLDLTSPSDGTVPTASRSAAAARPRSGTHTPTPFAYATRARYRYPAHRRPPPGGPFHVTRRTNAPAHLVPDRRRLVRPTAHRTPSAP